MTPELLARILRYTVLPETLDTVHEDIHYLLVDNGVPAFELSIDEDAATKATDYMKKVLAELNRINPHLEGGWS